MAELLGPVLVLGALIWTLGAMITGRAGWVTTGRARHGVRRYERRPVSWLGALRWVPVGFALAKVIGVPLDVTIMLSIFVAVVHRAAPDALDIVVAGGGLAVTLNELIGGDICRGPLGLGRISAVLLATSLAVALSVLTGGLRASALAAAAVNGFSIAELSLFAIAPPGMLLFDEPRYAVGALALLGVVAVLSALRPAFSHSALGVGLIAGDLLLAVTAVPCAPAAQVSLIGAGCFAASRYLLARRSVRQRLALR